MQAAGSTTAFAVSTTMPPGCGVADARAQTRFFYSRGKGELEQALAQVAQVYSCSLKRKMEHGLLERALQLSPLPKGRANQLTLLRTAIG